MIRSEVSQASSWSWHLSHLLDNIFVLRNHFTESPSENDAGIPMYLAFLPLFIITKPSFCYQCKTILNTLFREYTIQMIILKNLKRIICKYLLLNTIITVYAYNNAIVTFLKHLCTYKAKTMKAL